MSQCDKSTSLEVGVDVRSRLTNTGARRCQVGDVTSHELVATNYGGSTFMVRCVSAVLGDGVSYPEGEDPWSSELLLPPALPRAIAASTSKSLVLKPESDSDAAAIETDVEVGPLVGPGHYKASPVVIFLKL